MSGSAAARVVARAARTSTVARPVGTNVVGGKIALTANQLSSASAFSTQAGSTTDMTVRAAASPAALAAARAAARPAALAATTAAARAAASAATSAAASEATVARTNRVAKLALTANQLSSASAFSTQAGLTTDNTQDAIKAAQEFIEKLMRFDHGRKVKLIELEQLHTEAVNKGAKLPEFYPSKMGPCFSVPEINQYKREYLAHFQTAAFSRDLSLKKK